MKNAAYTVHHLSVNYDKTPVLWDISFTIPQGALVGIVGPNGAGKSTLLKASLGLIPTIGGSVTFFGRPLKEVQKKIAYVPQRTSIDWNFPITVVELVLMGIYGRLGLFRSPKKGDRDQAMDCLRLVGIEDLAHRQISQLSGGQQQRAFLARALMQDADLYFMDEPFSGVDHGTEKVIVELLKDLKTKGKTVMVVHHDLNTIESYFDWGVLLNLRLVASGPIEECFTRENLGQMYGKSYALFDQALRLKAEGP